MKEAITAGVDNVFSYISNLHPATILFGILYEIISVVIIFGLWTRKRRVAIVERCLLSLVLLVPFFGWFIYAFLKPSPDGHPYDLHQQWDGHGDGRGDSPPSDHSSH